MTLLLNYQDTATFVTVSADSYGNTKVIEEQYDVPVIILQNTGFVHSTNQDALTADAVLYPDPLNSFISDNHNRLEGMYVVMPLYGDSADDGWYKITHVSVNRDHLLTNSIDNIECSLKRTTPIQGVS